MRQLQLYLRQISSVWCVPSNIIASEGGYDTLGRSAAAVVVVVVESSPQLLSPSPSVLPMREVARPCWLPSVALRAAAAADGRGVDVRVEAACAAAAEVVECFGNAGASRG